MNARRRDPVHSQRLILLVAVAGAAGLTAESVLLTVGVAALAGSIALDVVGWDSSTRRVVEEGSKLLGAMLWSAYPAALLLRWLTPPPARGEA